ncbi:hypothetical protein H8L32_17965 [Undibacterium sp. CY18W]|uniref:Uncharacterized protein n=1 Tax=Undibacterium hunanense TaxID=2762292 RepID=A0ABR6ZU42_9BURK|nr:hypothetical protein [Undibacterium hunanense]MBC3919382.1 hypothetical protein [Undibacterium hunanense]
MNEDESKEVQPLVPLVADNANKNFIEGFVPEVVNGLVLPAPRKKALPFSKWLPFIAGAVIGVVLRLVFSGTTGSAYTAMASAFIWLVPMAVGVSTVFVAECQTRQSWWFYVTGPIVANTLFVSGRVDISFRRSISPIARAGKACGAVRAGAPDKTRNAVQPALWGKPGGNGSETSPGVVVRRSLGLPSSAPHA